MGLVYGFLTILLFGSWAAPTRNSKLDLRQLLFWVTAGHFLCSAIIYCVFSRKDFSTDFLITVGAGIVWTLGLYLGLSSIRKIGVTRAIGIWVPVVIAVGVFWGLFYFGEFWTNSPFKLAFIVIATCLVLLAATLVMNSKEKGTSDSEDRSGIWGAIGLGLCHGSYFVPLHGSALTVESLFLPLSLGMVLASTALCCWSKMTIAANSFEISRAISSGLILAAGNLLYFYTIQSLGVAIGQPMTQFALVVNTLWGMLFFGEVSQPSQRRRVWVAVGIVIFAAGLLSLINLVPATK